MATSTKSINDVPFRETVPVPVEWLQLDRKNPRLVGATAASSDESIVAQLYRGEEVGELLQSIAANGYLDIEPLIVAVEEDEILTVLEGNRRLAAIRLFREPEFFERVTKTERVRISLPTISDQHLSTLNQVSVYRVADRNEARSFIGFKHINGAAKWESYAKAKFAADWYESGDVSLEQISEMIGDKHDTIKRMVSAIFVLDQAEEADLFTISDRISNKFNFSHLYTALSRTPYMDFLGLETAWARYDPEPNPIPSDKLGELRELFLWIYGSKDEDIEPVIRVQNPDIKRLGETLMSAEGLHMLRAGSPLEDAHSSTRPADEKLSSALIQARSKLREAANSLRGYDGRDQSLLNISEDVSETAQSIHTRMNKKYKEISDADKWVQIYIFRRMILISQIPILIRLLILSNYRLFFLKEAKRTPRTL